MEESQKRRERLKAMRLEATTVVSSSSSSSSQQTLNSAMQPPLANPLLQNLDSSLPATPPPRFDFYTDPMAAYSTDKRRPFTPRPNFSPSSHVPTGLRNPAMPYPGAHQFQSNHAFHQGMYQGGGPYHSPSCREPTSSPMGWNQHPMHQGSPDFRTPPGRGPCFNNTPSPGSGYGGTPNPVYQGSPNFKSPPQGRDHWSNNSPRPSLGHGGGRSPSVGRGGSCMSPSSGYSGGRGRSFYNKSMVEDPWKSLAPTIWKADKENDASSFSKRMIQNFHKTPTSQKTTPAKKARISIPVNASNLKLSLAEYLSESFVDAENSTDAVEKTIDVVEDTTV